MCSESFPKEFEKTTEVLPFTRYGLSSIEEFKEAEKEIDQVERLKKAGLTSEEIQMYKDNEAGLIGRNKIELNILKEKLKAIYAKINKLTCELESSDEEDDQPSTSRNASESAPKEIPKKSPELYPDGHPMNNINEIEENMFGHLKNDDIMPINKRRKILRHLERKKERMMAQDNKIDIGTVPNTSKVDRPGSLWDVRELPHKLPRNVLPDRVVFGQREPTMYTVKDDKIVRLEPVKREGIWRRDVYRAVDIMSPVNEAEVKLLEGTKMCIDDIKKIDSFQNYEPGIPAKTLYLKNIAPSVSLEQLSLLFNQFMLANGGPIDVRLMTGHMRGQAFVAFRTTDIAIQALEEVNGTIMSGRPVIAQFGRNTSRNQDNDR